MIDQSQLEDEGPYPTPVSFRLKVAMPCSTVVDRDRGGTVEVEPPPRELYCETYNACLWYAELMRWPSFSCAECRAYKRMSMYDEYQDLYGIADLFEEIMAPPSATRRPKRQGEEGRQDEAEDNDDDLYWGGDDEMTGVEL